MTGFLFAEGDIVRIDKKTPGIVQTINMTASALATTRSAPTVAPSKSRSAASACANCMTMADDLAQTR